MCTTVSHQGHCLSQARPHAVCGLSDSTRADHNPQWRSMVTEWESALGLEDWACAVISMTEWTATSQRTNRIFSDTSLQNHRDQYHRGTGCTLDLPKPSTVHASPRARNHLLRLMGRSRWKFLCPLVTSPSLASCHWTTLSCIWRHCPAHGSGAKNRPCSPWWAQPRWCSRPRCRKAPNENANKKQAGAYSAMSDAAFWRWVSPSMLPSSTANTTTCYGEANQLNCSRSV